VVDIERFGNRHHGLTGVTPGDGFLTLVVCQLRLATEPDALL
jgi:hypothetical protein